MDRTENAKEGLENFLETFREKNKDVTRYGSERAVEAVTGGDKNEKKFSQTKISDREITSDGIK